MMQWESVSECEPPAEWERRLGWAHNWDHPSIVAWKQNSRHDGSDLEGLWYWGDPDEKDDFDMLPGEELAPLFVAKIGDLP